MPNSEIVCLDLSSIILFPVTAFIIEFVLFGNGKGSFVTSVFKNTDVSL